MSNAENSHPDSASPGAGPESFDVSRLDPGPVEPLRLGPVNDAELAQAVEGLIISASGWRKIFGSDRGVPDAVVPVDRFLVALIGESFAGYLEERGVRTVALGIDTRPTGPAIANILARVLVSRGLELSYGGITAAPEIMAYARTTEAVDAFLLVTASHNPVEHNGFKFGTGDGAVISAGEAAHLEASFRRNLADPRALDLVRDQCAGVNADDLGRLFARVDAVKAEMSECYRSSLAEVVTGIPDTEYRSFVMGRLRDRLRESAPGIVIDFNGGARSASVDRAFLSDLGIRSSALNDVPGRIAHTIVPEGGALSECAHALEKLRREDPAYTLGYVTDNDGDRGNLVFYDYGRQEVRQLHAQEVFALVTAAELAWLVRTGMIGYDENGRCLQKVAVAVNGATSLRVDRIAAAFDADVFRAEVGEANVVGLARSLRQRGFICRILGEGSNGGCIIHPAEVRDPIATVGALLKLLYTPSLGNKPNGNTAPSGKVYGGQGSENHAVRAVGSDLFAVWCERSGRPDAYRPDYTLSDVLSTLPAFTTTGTTEARARLHVAEEHGPLKAAYEDLFARRWPELQRRFGDRLDLYGWEAINYEGTSENHGIGSANRTGRERGGFKILLKNSFGRPIGFIWMRGSGTEPVFRIMADLEGDVPALEAELLQWHADLIHEAAERAR